MNTVLIASCIIGMVVCVVGLIKCWISISNIPEEIIKEIRREQNIDR